MSDWGGFWIAMAMLCIAFYGEPDLADALRAHLYQPTCVSAQP